MLWPAPSRKMEKPLAVGALFTKRKNREIAENIMYSLFDYLPKADRMGRKNRSRCRHKNGRHT